MSISVEHITDMKENVIFMFMQFQIKSPAAFLWTESPHALTQCFYFEIFIKLFCGKCIFFTTEINFMLEKVKCRKTVLYPVVECN